MCSEAISPKLIVTPNCAYAYLIPSTNSFIEASDGFDPALMPDFFFCTACKPGFKGIPYSDLVSINYTHGKITCDAILNCDIVSSNTWYNSCETCEIGHAWGYDSVNRKILYDECVPLTPPLDNCAVVAGSTCIFCKKGYHIDLANNLCLSETPEYCASNNLINIERGFKAFAFYMTEMGPGCVKCDSGYTPLQSYIPF